MFTRNPSISCVVSYLKLFDSLQYVYFYLPVDPI